MSIGGTRAKSVSRFLHCTLWGWRHLVNNLHTVAKMAASSSATAVKIARKIPDRPNRAAG